jgi:hypothetical protein
MPSHNTREAQHAIDIDRVPAERRKFYAGRTGRRWRTKSQIQADRIIGETPKPSMPKTLNTCLADAPLRADIQRIYYLCPV